MKHKLIFYIILFVSTTGCTSSLTRISTRLTDRPATIICYSGGKEILATETEGKPLSEQNSDGYLFRDKTTGRLVEVSADCVITYQ